MAIEYRTVNGIEYAMIGKSVRIGGKVRKEPRVNLGPVIDKEKGIYKNRERGLYSYDPATGEYGRVPPGFIEPATRRKKKPRDREILEVEFGSSYFFDSFVAKLGYWDVLDAMLYPNNDTLHALLMHYCIQPYSNRVASFWWSHSYARVLYLRAQLSSQRISETLVLQGLLQEAQGEAAGEEGEGIRDGRRFPWRGDIDRQHRPARLLLPTCDGD